MGGRQLKTDARRLVEITLMRQPHRHRTLVQFVNLSGHGDTAYFDPVPMRDITVELAATFTRARATVLDQDLAVTGEGRHRTFTLPRLEAYEVVVIGD